MASGLPTTCALPIALAIGSLVARFVRMVLCVLKKIEKPGPQERFVLLLGVWWVLDMAFVWVSPRSYEQYYLPLTASAAMLGGYLVWLYHAKLTQSMHKGRWIAVGGLAVICMALMSQHIFFGLIRSPFSGQKYSQRSKFIR